MRVLHLLASPVYSGPCELVAELALAQRALGHDAHVAVDRKRGDLGSEEPAVPRLRALGLLDEGGLELSVKSGPAAVWRDVRALRRRAVDVVHAHFSHDHTLARLGTPRGALLVRSIHAPRSLRWSTPHADAWTCPTSRLLGRVAPRPALVLPPLVGERFVPAADRAAVRAALGLGEGPLLGMVSALQPSRRHALGLEAFARVRARQHDARLCLVGDGALEAPLRAQAAALGLGDAVHFAGYAAGDAFVRWLQALDEVWVLGLGNDWSGRAAAQARACGARTVGVDEGALADWVDQVVAPTAEAVAAAALGSTRRAVGLPAPAEVARRVLALYEQARA